MKEFAHRRTLLPFLAKGLKAKNYLEIGVRAGRTFMPIKAWKKYAVDPKFMIKPSYKRSETLKWIPNLWAKYFEVTSDEFFANHVDSVLKKGSLDLAFIDGLHTYEQTYIDVVNTLPYVHKGSVILLHDCSPKSYSAAYPAKSIEEARSLNLPGWDRKWSGDVWKVVPRLKLQHPELRVGIVDQDSGLGIVVLNQEKQTEKLDYTLEDIDQWDYEYLDKNRNEVINIIEPEEAMRWLEPLFNR